MSGGWSLSKTIFLALLMLLMIFKAEGSVISRINSPDETLKDSIDSYKKEAIRLAGEGNYKESLNYFNRILKLKNKIYKANNPEIGHTYVNIGVIFKKQGYYDKSIEYYKRAEKIYEIQDYNNYRKIGTNYLNMANVFSQQKDKEKAEIYYQKALELFKTDSINNMDRIASILNNLGILYSNYGQYDKAIKYYERSLSIKKKLEKSNYINTLGNIAVLYHRLGKYKISSRYYIKVINEINNIYGNSNYHLGINYMNYAVTQMAQENFLIAEQYLKLALDIYNKYLEPNHPNNAMIYLNLGVLYSKKQEIKQSLNYFQQALISISENFTDTSIFANPEISDVFQKTIFLDILKKKARRFSELGEKNDKYYNAALETYDLAIETTREIRKGYMNEDSKLLLASEEKDTYIQALEIAIKLYEKTNDEKYYKKAFSYAEGTKASVLYESIQSNQALMIGNIPDSLKNKENKLKKKIFFLEELVFEEKNSKDPDKQKMANWNEQLFQLNKTYEDLIKKFEKEYPRFYQLKYNLKPVDLTAIQNKMDEDEVIIEYVLHSHKITAFQISKEDFSIHQTKIDTNFADIVYEFRNNFSARNFSDHTLADFKSFQNTAYHLYSKLIAPLDLKNDTRLTIIPDEVLSYIPFEILVTQNNDIQTIDYDKLEYLIKKYYVGYAYSAKVLFNDPLNTQDSKKKLAAFAPSYQNIENLKELELATRQKYREKLYPLKGIIEEANKIAEIIPGDVYSKEHATEQKFKQNASEYDILHLAMHTIINDKDPMYSKMAFTQSNDKNEDGFLNTYEIYNLNLSSRLTVLSSCNTGTGKLRKGEGVMSLARGFKYAGCPSIVMTMWPVEDNSSVRMMEYFYEAVKSGKTKDEALRAAKLKFLKNSDPLHSHPYFWSGYILVGDKDAIYINPAYYYGGSGVLILIILLAAILVYRKKKRT